MRFWSWFQSFFRREKSPEPRILSLVILLRESRYLDPVILRKLAARAFQVEFDDLNGDSDPDESENSIVRSKDDVNYLIRARGETFLINNYPRAYVEDVIRIGGEIAELRFRQAFLEHRAWLSVDRYGSSRMSDAEALHWIGRLTAELLDDDCTAIYCPTNSQGCVYEERLEDQLRSQNPLSIFEGQQRPPVIGIPDDDPEMQRAVQEARGRWPEFVSAFENRHDADIFSVKAPLGYGGCTEFMWLSVGAIENEIIYGRLDNDPVSLSKMKAGDRVRVPVAKLNDWLYIAGDQQQGGFTVAILMAKQLRRDKP